MAGICETSNGQRYSAVSTPAFQTQFRRFLAFEQVVRAVIDCNNRTPSSM
jgi:hypothetical protein